MNIYMYKMCVLSDLFLIYKALNESDVKKALKQWKEKP